MYHCAGCAIVPAHDVEAFEQGSLMIVCGESFFQVVDEGQVGVVKHIGLFHDPYAPVEVGREAVMQVIERGDGAAGEEGLMAYEHSLLEAFPVQMFGRAQPAHTDEMSFVVDDGCLSIDDIRDFRAVVVRQHRVHDALQCVVFMQAVTGVEETDIVACRQSQAFVHGVIQPFVRFTDDRVDVFSVSFDDVQGVVGRSPVDDDVFHIAIGLCDDALYRVFQDCACIVGHSDDGKFRMKV